MCRQEGVNMFPNLTTFEENIFISKVTFLLGKHIQVEQSNFYSRLSKCRMRYSLKKITHHSGDCIFIVIFNIRR